jgi:hypothetical protein
VTSIVNDAHGSCSGISAGLSGLVPIGVVEHEHDISLHIRSGINRSECVFDSSQPQLRLKPSWAIIDRKWKVDHARGPSDACGVRYHSASEPAGTRFYVHAHVACDGGPDNDNGLRLTLQRITLVGPLNGSPMDAFISGTKR